MNYFGVIEIVSAAVGFFHAYQSSSSSDDAVSNLHPEPFAPKTLCLFASELFARQRRAEQLRRKKKKKNLKHTCLWTESKTLCWYVQPLIISYRIDKKKLIPAHAKS